MSNLTLDLLSSLQVLAAKAAVDPNFRDWYRRICRWYSKEFSTSLQEVMNLSEEEVILTYFEDFYYQLSQKNDDNGKAAFDAALEQLISEKTGVTEEAQEDDDEWYKAELARLQEVKTENDKSLQTDSPKSDDNMYRSAKGDINPNLMEELPDNIFVNGEDSSSGEDS